MTTLSVGSFRIGCGTQKLGIYARPFLAVAVLLLTGCGGGGGASQNSTSMLPAGDYVESGGIGGSRLALYLESGSGGTVSGVLDIGPTIVDSNSIGPIAANTGPFPLLAKVTGTLSNGSYQLIGSAGATAFSLVGTLPVESAAGSLSFTSSGTTIIGSFSPPLATSPYAGTYSGVIVSSTGSLSDGAGTSTVTVLPDGAIMIADISPAGTPVVPALKGYVASDGMFVLPQPGADLVTSFTAGITGFGTFNGSSGDSSISLGYSLNASGVDSGLDYKEYVGVSRTASISAGPIETNSALLGSYTGAANFAGQVGSFQMTVLGNGQISGTVTPPSGSPFPLVGYAESSTLLWLVAVNNTQVYSSYLGNSNLLDSEFQGTLTGNTAASGGQQQTVTLSGTKQLQPTN